LKALRFWPITAALCAFMAAFGVGTNMKVQFLAVTILVYLIPAIAQRITAVDETKVQKVKTLGFTKWQTIRHVFIPQGLGWGWDDITNLVAISWTYIVFVEMINRSQGGVGSYIYDAYYRQHKTYLLWGVMILLIVWGAIQDQLFHFGSRMIFEWKSRKER
jgi:ABC-type nitrate/sulfonate/bicarbonate transport system permease component